VKTACENILARHEHSAPDIQDTSKPYKTIKAILYFQIINGTVTDIFKTERKGKHLRVPVKYYTCLTTNQYFMYEQHLHRHSQYTN
jgi:hypothetical protein